MNLPLTRVWLCSVTVRYDFSVWLYITNVLYDCTGLFTVWWYGTHILYGCTVPMYSINVRCALPFLSALGLWCKIVYHTNVEVYYLKIKRYGSHYFKWAEKFVWYHFWFVMGHLYSIHTNFVIFFHGLSNFPQKSPCICYVLLLFWRPSAPCLFITFPTSRGL